MDTTSESLLFRLNQSSDASVEQNAWREFVELYTPLIFSWSRKIGLDINDASDLVQDVLTRVFEKIPSFQYDKSKRFRSWLKTLTLNRYRESLRRKSAQQVVASNSVLEQFQEIQHAESTWDIDYAKLLISQAMLSMKPDFAETTWRALELVVGCQMTVDAAAQETNVSTWTIYSARSRLLKRLRSELDGLL